MFRPLIFWVKKSPSFSIPWSHTMFRTRPHLLLKQKRERARNTNSPFWRQRASFGGHSNQHESIRSSISFMHYTLVCFSIRVDVVVSLWRMRRCHCNGGWRRVKDPSDEDDKEWSCFNSYLTDKGQAISLWIPLYSDFFSIPPLSLHLFLRVLSVSIFCEFIVVVSQMWWWGSVIWRDWRRWMKELHIERRRRENRDFHKRKMRGNPELLWGELWWCERESENLENWEGIESVWRFGWMNS